jgi:hypothetical protein
MTKERLKKEAEEWLNKWELCNKCENKVDCISNFSYCKKVVLQSYLAGAEPREKRIEELEEKIKELETLNKELQCCANCRHSYGGEEEPSHDCGYCHAMNCICKLKLKEHTSDIYRMWEDKCERWEMRLN